MKINKPHPTITQRILPWNAELKTFAKAITSPVDMLR